MSGLIAIVGRPNVGKSALFNRIVRRRIAIVHDQPGVTRDRVSIEAEWQGRPYTLVDTGGIGLLRHEKAPDVITEAALQQVELAIEAANVIILVVNVQEGVVPLDREVAERLHRAKKPVLVAVNKVDTTRLESGADEFAALGFDKIFPVTAIHGEGITELMSEAAKLLPESTTVEAQPVDAESETAAEEAGVKPERKATGPMKIAIVGRPNVGKSSIINALTQSERVIVSPIPGTTRDAVDVPFSVETEGVRQDYTLIDTAGVRKENRINDSVEFYSVQRTNESIARADLVVFVLDAESGIIEQDKKIGAKIVEERKACIVVINKWDLYKDSVTAARAKEIAKRNNRERVRSEGTEEKLTTLAEFAQWVQENLFFLDYAPVIFTSAKTGFHLDRLLEAVRYVAAQLQQKIPTSILNRTINDAILGQQPVSSTGHQLKFFYASQVRTAPPTFLLFVNRDELFSPAYEKYLKGKLRAAFGFEGCPIILVPKARPKTVESIRKFKPRGGAPRVQTRERKGSKKAFARRPDRQHSSRPQR